MKGISTVIATILMLMITIALAGTAYLYISGTFTQQTAVVLEILDATCSGDPISVTVQNSGTAVAGAITVSATLPGGGSAGSCTVDGDAGVAGIQNLNPGTSGSCTIDRAAGAAIGTYSLTATATGARPVRGPVSCATLGV